jgi:glutamate N-acetyltransferase/amino-acid N-acetyltransferase
MIPRGFRYAGARCGLKNKRNDIGLIISDHPTAAAGLLTTNQVRAACVDYTRRVISEGNVRAIVVNSGNANCATGEQGRRDTQRMAELAAGALNLSPDQVAVASTGVIGQLLDMAKVEAGIAEAGTRFGENPVPFMEAILTTDLVEKQSRAELPGGAVIYGVAKGSGMISPNMATMLAFITTDADTSVFSLNDSLRAAASVSFNCMTVDGDTSTNDMLLLLANGASGVAASAEDFQAGLNAVCTDLAKQVARDGEGATKLIEVRVTGSEDPKRIARSIADSPLVKTAMFGCDPNWGRIMMAAGKAGVPFNPDGSVLALLIDGEEYPLFERGTPASFDPKRTSTALKHDHVIIDLRLGEGESAVVYTCDFGYGYVRINAEYHT